VEFGIADAVVGLHPDDGEADAGVVQVAVIVGGDGLGADADAAAAEAVEDLVGDAGVAAVVVGVEQRVGGVDEFDGAQALLGGEELDLAGDLFVRQAGALEGGVFAAGAVVAVSATLLADGRDVERADRFDGVGEEGGFGGAAALGQALVQRAAGAEARVGEKGYVEAGVRAGGRGERGHLAPQIFEVVLEHASRK